LRKSHKNYRKTRLEGFGGDLGCSHRGAMIKEFETPRSRSNRIKSASRSRRPMACTSSSNHTRADRELEPSALTRVQSAALTNWLQTATTDPNNRSNDSTSKSTSCEVNQNSRAVPNLATQPHVSENPGFLEKPGFQFPCCYLNLRHTFNQFYGSTPSTSCARPVASISSANTPINNDGFVCRCA